MSAPSRTVTKLGTVTSQRVIINSQQLRGSSQHDIPLDQITSVRQEVERDYLRSGLAVVLGLVILALTGTSVAGVVVLVLCFGLAALLWIGSPVVSITTTGGEVIQLNARKAGPAEAGRFTNAIRDELFPDD